MAWASFFYLLAVGLSVLYGLVWSPNPMVVAEALNAAATVFTSVCGFFTVIVLGYLGLSMAESTFKK